MPDVLLDLTPLDTPSRYRGIGRYVSGLARGIAALSPEERRGLTIEGLVRHRGSTPPLTDPTLLYGGDPEYRPTRLRYRRYLFERRLFLGGVARRAGGRLVHLTETRGTPIDRRVPKVVTCYDLIPLVLHRTYLGRAPGRRLLEELLDRRRFRTAVRVLAISEATKRDLVEHVQVDPDRIDVTPLGVEHDRFHPRRDPAERAAVASIVGGDRPFLLYVGAGDWRKNLPFLVRAYARSGSAADADLVLAGMLSPTESAALAETARTAGVEGRVRIVGYVDERHVPALYRACLGHVFASRYEGFGLPVLEAMACGAPTVTSIETSLAEVAGDAALTASADDEEDFAAAIRRLVEDDALRADLSRRGPLQAQRFTWSACARATVDTYVRALGG